MTTLNHNQLNEEQTRLYEEAQQAKTTVLQIGEGNFCAASSTGCCMNAGSKAYLKAVLS